MRTVYNHYNPTNAIFSVIPEFPKYSKIQDILSFDLQHSQTIKLVRAIIPNDPFDPGIMISDSSRQTPFFLTSRGSRDFMTSRQSSVPRILWNVPFCPFILFLWKLQLPQVFPSRFPGVHEILGVLGTPDFFKCLVLSRYHDVLEVPGTPVFPHVPLSHNTLQKRLQRGGTNCIAYISPRHLQNAFD